MIWVWYDIGIYDHMICDYSNSNICKYTYFYSELIPKISAWATDSQLNRLAFQAMMFFEMMLESITEWPLLMEEILHTGDA